MTYANPRALVETDWLAGRLDDRGIAVVEVDEDTDAYDGGHIPGAVPLDWKRELQARPRRDFVGSEQLAALLASKGISDDQRIILYGGNSNWFATYAYWLMRYRGIDKVSVLNGGRVKWELEKRPMTTELPQPNGRRRFRPRPTRPELRALRQDVLDRALHGGGTMVDVRSPAEYRGEVLAPPHLPSEQPYVPGHVPGAANIPWSSAANQDGTYKTALELTELFARAGITPGQDVITYCRIGERASHTWFALSELLGFDKVRNYDGSWTEYGSMVDVPVAIGPAA